MLSKSECLNLLQRLANHPDPGHAEKIFTDLPPLMRYGRPAVDEGLWRSGGKEDEVAKRQYPGDADPLFVPITVYGDGNCLYRSLSLLLYATEEHHLELRLRCVLELTRNTASYAKQCVTAAQRVKACGGSKYSVDALLSGTLSEGPALEAFFNTAVKVKRHDLQDRYTAALAEEVVQSSKPGKYASLPHIMALANVVGLQIQTIYPMLDTGFRAFMNTTVVPQDIAAGVSQVSTVKIMWTSLTKEVSAKTWKPDHFVVVIKKSLQTAAALSSGSAKPGQRKPGVRTLFDFWPPESRQLHRKKKAQKPVSSQCSSPLSGQSSPERLSVSPSPPSSPEKKHEPALSRPTSSPENTSGSGCASPSPPLSSSPECLSPLPMASPSGQLDPPKSATSSEHLSQSPVPQPPCESTDFHPADFPLDKPNHPGPSYSFPKRDFGKKVVVKRSCKFEWFQTWPWLHYDEEKDVVLCHVCLSALQAKKMTVKRGDSAFLSKGFSNWKDATTSFKAHESSACH